MVQQQHYSWRILHNKIPTALTTYCCNIAKQRARNRHRTHDQFFKSFYGCCLLQEEANLIALEETFHISGLCPHKGAVNLRLQSE